MNTSRSAPGTPTNRVVALDTWLPTKPKFGWPGPTTFVVVVVAPLVATLEGLDGAMDTRWNGVPPGACTPPKAELPPNTPPNASSRSAVRLASAMRTRN